MEPTGHVYRTEGRAHERRIIEALHADVYCTEGRGSNPNLLDIRTRRTNEVVGCMRGMNGSWYFIETDLRSKHGKELDEFLQKLQ